MMSYMLRRESTPQTPMVIESPGAPRSPSDNWHWKDTIDDDYYNNYDDNNNYDDDTNNDNYDNSPDDDNNNNNYDDSQDIAVPVTQTTEIVQIQHIPQKGITAWLDHLNRKNKRKSMYEYLKGLVFGL